MASFAFMGPMAVCYSLTAHVWLKFVRRVLGRLESSVERAVLSPPFSDDINSSPRQCIAVVTGSNTGIGYETALALVVQHGWTVILACRSRDKAERAVQQIQQQQQQQQQQSHEQGTAVFVHPLDLSSPESVREFCQHVRQRYTHIDLLINNAGRNSGSGTPICVAASSLSSETSCTEESNSSSNQEKLDLMFQSNFLGHFLLTAELLPLLQAASDNDSSSNNSNNKARIVNVSSVMHHFSATAATTASTTNMETVEAWKATACHATTQNTYSLSKLAAILFTGELNRRFGCGSNHTTAKTTIATKHPIQAIAVNPGGVHSDIWRDYPSFLAPLFRWLLLTPSQGCRTSVAASVLDDSLIHTNNGNNDDNTYSYHPYLQPYWQPFRNDDDDTNTNNDNNNTTTTTSATPLFPVLEMLGPYQGYRWTTPRLPSQPSVAGAALWQASVELTGAQWPLTASANSS